MSAPCDICPLQDWNAQVWKREIGLQTAVVAAEHERDEARTRVDELMDEVAELRGVLEFVAYRRGHFLVDQCFEEWNERKASDGEPAA
jgi:hypothetical protein